MWVIVTGTRHPERDDVARVHTALDLALCWATAAGERLEVVHSDGDGIDQAAHWWCRAAARHGRPASEHPYPAAWRTFGRRAGRLRNEQMWTHHWHQLDLCIAFPAPDSVGTLHCIELAEKHHCPVWRNPTGHALTAPPPARLVPHVWSRTPDAHRAPPPLPRTP